MKVVTVIGTRPEAIKMAPVLSALATCQNVVSRLCVTGQHRDLAVSALVFFGIDPDEDLQLMGDGQGLNEFVGRAMLGIGRILEAEKPDRVLVQGDTASAFAGASAAYQLGIPVAHVEAGLRTFDTSNPWPEEGYRQAIDNIADMLFAPTAAAASNLFSAPGRTIFVTGNSGVDATRAVLGRLSRDKALRQEADAAIPPRPDLRPLVLATIHRRESFGAPLQRICEALARIAQAGSRIVLPVHPNPDVGSVVRATLSGCPQISLLDPLPLPAMIRLIQRVDLVLTDSGGVQEEAATLGKQALILRTTTDRPESIVTGQARLVGTDTDTIVAAAETEIEQIGRSPLHPVPTNPFGDGRAAERIAAALLGCDMQPFQPLPLQQDPVRVRLVG